MKVEKIYKFDLYDAEWSGFYCGCTSKSLPVVGEKFLHTYLCKEASTNGVVISVEEYTKSDGSTFIRFVTRIEFKNSKLKTRDFINFMF